MCKVEREMTQNSKVRVRFPPSPTGFLHVGGARTALFNWLFAKATGGKFLLRIEDTDRERSEERFTDDIKESLQWLGLQWDEEPVFQSKRLDRHREVAEQLVAKGLAYKCDCTQEELEAIRKNFLEKKLPYRYPGTCRDKKTHRKDFVLRVRNPDTGETRFTDLIRGDITIPNKDIEDWVLVRTDGNPTYNFAVVVDDHDMGITHVLRGEDHINNTPKQALLYKALGYDLPFFAHFPMILGKDKAKLSKRHGAASTLEYRKMGYLPETMINFLVRLGWSHGDQEVFSVDELKKAFNLDAVGKANAIFNTEKLDWISGIQLRAKPAKELTSYIRKYFAEEISPYASIDPARFESGVAIIQGKVKLIPELIEQMDCLFGPDPSYPADGLKGEEKVLAKQVITDLKPLLASNPYTVESLEKAVRGYAEEKEIGFGKLAKATRFALTGGKISPGLFEMMAVQGKETVSRRFDNLLKSLP